MTKNTQNTKLPMHVMWQLPAAILGMALFAMPAVPSRAADANTPPTLTPAAEKPTLRVVLRGVLVDADGEPVNEGFLMLQGNPHLNALTSYDGRFRIEGNAWEMPDVLLASCAGSTVSQIKIEKPQADGLKIRMERRDPVFTQIEMGMSLKGRWAYPYPGSHPMTAAERECLQACDAFIASRGEAIIAKMLAGTPLAEDEQQYEYLLAAEIRIRAATLSEATFTAMSATIADVDRSLETKYCAAAQQEFYRISIKAMRRARLTTEDMHHLRLWIANCGPTGANPMNLNQSFWGDLVKFGGNLAKGPTPGAPLPFDVPLIRTTPLLKSKGWTNYTSLSAADYLRLEGLWPCLDFYAKWEVRDGFLAQSPSEAWKTRYWQDDYQVTSMKELVMQAHGNPVFFICMNYADLTGFGFLQRQNEYFRRAYRGAVDVYITSQATDSNYLDIFVDEWTFYGPNPKANPRVGLACPRWETQNYTPFRQARMDKLCLMNFIPFGSGEILQDLTRFNTYLGTQISDSAMGLLDRDGKVAEPFPGPELMTYVALQNRAYADAPSAYTHPRRGGDNYWGMLLYEQTMRALSANGGRFAPNLFDHVLVQYPRLLNAESDIFVVTSVDKARQLIHAGWINPGGLAARTYRGGGDGNPAWGGTPKGDFLLKISPETRYVVRCKDGQPAWETYINVDDTPGATFKLIGLDDIKPGDRFFATIRFPEPIAPDVPMASFMKRLPNVSKEQLALEHRPAALDMAVYEGQELHVERLENYLQLSTYGSMADFKLMPLYGKLIKKEGHVITVQFQREDATAMWGYRFCKEEEDKGCSMDRLDPHFYPVYKRWATGTDEDRTYRFKVDGATEVYRNGLLAEAGDLAEGDYVFVEYEMWWEKQKLQKELILPERVQAGAPIGNSQP